MTSLPPAEQTVPPPSTAKPNLAPLSTANLTVRVGARTLVESLTAEFSPGEFVAILGRNGCGKTLTLHTLAGLRPASNGSVHMDGRPLTQINQRDIARRLGVLTQDLEEGFATTALESVLIGRHPHLSLWQWETDEDEQVARKALAAVDLADFAPRLTDTLSGGERRRVAVASLLAQDPALFLLDEPTNHLDPHHQLAVLSLFHELTHNGRTVIATLHDPTLAARFADRAILLSGDGSWRAGPVEEVITAASLSELYFTPIVELRQDGRRVFTPA
ncbi:MAG TPA: ABC transporter ATP-binding protein [Steroidobacteraceae bacterium]|jgi:iron complex transport system ATP-binding protein